MTNDSLFCVIIMITISTHVHHIIEQKIKKKKMAEDPCLEATKHCLAGAVCFEIVVLFHFQYFSVHFQFQVLRREEKDSFS